MFNDRKYCYIVRLKLPQKKEIELIHTKKYIARTQFERIKERLNKLYSDETFFEDKNIYSSSSKNNLYVKYEYQHFRSIVPYPELGLI